MVAGLLIVAKVGVGITRGPRMFALVRVVLIVTPPVCATLRFRSSYRMTVKFPWSSACDDRSESLSQFQPVRIKPSPPPWAGSGVGGNDSGAELSFLTP